ncbi:hypothetical protein MJ581_00380 [Escherichia coli]|nr:hypothetical protein MJ581_00380 [Escherichia coli]
MDNTILNNAYMEDTNVRGINLSKAADLSADSRAVVAQLLPRASCTHREGQERPFFLSWC